ncbi:hypothetical protein E8E11_002540 [Didymella keratinophila]|nr:hypothetical protein E8E11_002540 [Didymella keratinophila]
MSFLHPCDRRWQGPAQWFLYLDLVKNTVLFFFVILVIVEGALYRHWYMNYHSTAEFDSSETAAEWFVRIGLALILDILSTISTHTLLHTNPVRLQPIFALTQSLIVFCLYPSALFLNLIITYSDETGYTYIDAWQRLCYAEMG